MIATILIVSLAFYWLLRETDYFRIHLIRGAIPVKAKAYAAYKAYSTLSRKKTYEVPIYTGDNIPDDIEAEGFRTYNIVLSPGVDNVLCGWDWLNQHVADLENYNPKVYMSIGNVRYDMVIKDPSIIKDIVRVNHLTKREIQALA
ncbi:MAG: hypothetical protein WC554_11810 [Clostridia bacterium]|jgi:hypothetical protein